MALLETLTLQVGAALVKAAAKLWLKDRPFAEAASGALTDFFKTKIQDFATRDSTELLFQRIQREVGKRLDAFLAIEFSGAAANDLEAGALAVAEAFEQTSLVTIVDADLDPARLERTIDPGPRSRFEPLGGVATDAAQRLLAESCRYVVTIVGKLPNFQLEVSRALLQREREILEDITKALQAIAALHERIVANDRREGQRFEPNYRVYLINKLDRMQLFGLAQVGAGAREYGLSIAYVTLTVAGRGGAQSTTVDDALAGHAAIAIRGEAGSGKTTLMQWLAVRAASRDLLEPLAAWNERMPFYIKLRDYASAALPKPEQFLASAAPNLEGEMPDGWSHQVLRNNALLLLDGVDELPASRRQEFAGWLRDLRRDFPQAVLIVTSRPAALDAEHPLPLGAELASLGFASFTLEPMTLADSQALVAQWHAAVGRDRPGDRARLEAYERELLQALTDRPAIRNLAANPLLCAMICVLNWHHSRQLPDDRMELYRLALEVLLERREREREIQAFHLSGFDRKDKETILDDLAYWMLRNALSEAPRGEAEQQIGHSLKRMGRLMQATPAQVLQELLERSGVIRQPEPGAVSFIHRTFLEYMAARSALAAGDLNALVERASEESWREAIVFACGHASGKERDRLVRRLLGIPDPTLRGRIDQIRALFGGQPSIEAEVTAACCLETAARSLDPELLQELRERAARLFPPRDLATALLLKPAAEMDPTLLRGHAGRGADAVAACIRVAAAIGGPRMLDVIGEYAAVEGAAVDLEIARAWDAFDDEPYLDRVVKKRPTLFGIVAAELGDELLACLRLLVMSGQVQRADRTLASVLGRFRTAGELDLSAHAGAPADDPAARGPPAEAPPQRRGDRPVRSASKNYLARLTSLQSLSLSTSDPEVLDAVAQLPRLARLALRVEAPIDLAPLARLKTLTQLEVEGAAVRDLRPALAGSNVASLAVKSSPIESLAAMPLPGSLRDLDLHYLPRLDDLQGLAAHVPLATLKVSGSNAPIGAWIEALSGLERLQINYPKSSVGFDWSRLPKLQKVWLQGTAIATLAGIERADGLRELVVSKAVGSVVDGLAVPRQLSSLSVFGNGRDAVDCRNWPADAQLEWLYLHDLAEVRNADRLAELASLRYVSFHRCASVALSADARRRLEARGATVKIDG